MSPHRQDRIALYCHAVVARNFAMFHNPKYRGPNFDWASFPDMMAEQCKVSLFTWMQYSKKAAPEVEKHAHDTGRAIAVMLVKTMTE